MGLIQLGLPAKAAKSRRILLLTAPRPRPNYTPLHYGDNRAPQGLGYVAAYLEKFGHEVKIVDLYAFTWKYKDVLTAVQSPWRKHKDVLTGRNWARTMDGDIKTVEGHSRGGFAQNNSDGTMEVGTDLGKVIESFKPDFIGMYVHTMSFDTAVELSAALKRDYPDIPQMCGGPHPAVLHETMPETFDYVVVGEGETAVLDIVEGRTRERIVQGQRVVEMDGLPWPDLGHFWDKPYNWGLKLFGHEEIYPTISLNTSRGCGFKCSFCGVQAVSGARFRHISAKGIFDRIVHLREEYGARGIYFREDNFTISMRRIEELCDLIISHGMNIKWACESRVDNLKPPQIEKMARAGCVGLYIGVESGSDRVLALMKKGESTKDYEEKFPILKANGIAQYTTWVFGVPGERPEDRRLTESFIGKIAPTTVDCFVYIGIPISALYKEIVASDGFEFRDRNGFMYPKGYLGYVRELYGMDDPRVAYTERIYGENKITPVIYEW